jgi:hypothetical protein
VLLSQGDRVREWTEETNRMMTAQRNGIKSGADISESRVILVESSLEKQSRKLSEVAELIGVTAREAETSAQSIAQNVSEISGRFKSEIIDFSNEVVLELNRVSDAANGTLGNTKNSAAEFSESVKIMAESVAKTLSEMDKARDTLIAQSGLLTESGAKVYDQLKPLIKMMETLHGLLPNMSDGEIAIISESVAKAQSNLSELKSVMKEVVGGVKDSTGQLNKLTGESRQQMIDLMADYAKASDTLASLSRQISGTKNAVPVISSGGNIEGSADFGSILDNVAAGLHDQSFDLIKSLIAKIPEKVMLKYDSGERDIFSRWLAGILMKADKRALAKKLKDDIIFKNQADQFVRGYGKLEAIGGPGDIDGEDLFRQINDCLTKAMK